MIGREAYHNPWFLAAIERDVLGGSGPKDRAAVVRAWIPYVQRQLEAGQRLSAMSRHGLGLFAGQPGARAWRRTLSELAPRPGAGVEVIESALSRIEAASAAAAELTTD